MTCDDLSRIIEIVADIYPDISDDGKHTIETRIIAEFGGESLYIRKTPSNRALAIRRKFNGKNVNELAKEFGITVRSVYRHLSDK